MATFGFAFEAMPLASLEQGRESVEGCREEAETQKKEEELSGVCFSATFPGSLAFCGGRVGSRAVFGFPVLVSRKMPAFSGSGWRVSQFTRGNEEWPQSWSLGLHILG